jgi:putative MATE family efflux protein
VTLRSRYDGEILRLALPALGALAAEPLYVLVDTAVVGHLGRSQLAALGVASTVFSALVMFNFLQYGTTAQTARAVGAGEEETAARLGGQTLWLSLGFGILLAALIAALATPITHLVGAHGETARFAVVYVQIVAIGVPSAFLTLGGQGFLRGVADLRTPLTWVVAGNVANAVLEIWFVYGLHWGIRGSAWGTAIAQTGMGVGIAVSILRRIGLARAAFRPVIARRLLALGKHIFVRTAALMSSFVLAGAVVARAGDAPLAAHQVAYQLWIFLALVLDAIAIAGQIIVGRELGAGRPDAAYAASARMIELAVALGLAFTVAMLALRHVLPKGFTSDRAVLAQCALLWPLFALMQPLNGAVFALDGILIGASDGAFLAASMAAAFACCAGVLLVSLHEGWGVRGVWSALVVLIVVRLAALGLRFRRRRWLVTGFS